MLLRSHLTQVRGLKYWKNARNCSGRGRTSRRCVDWNDSSIRPNEYRNCRTSRRCVDWNNVTNFRFTRCCKSHLTQVRGLKYRTFGQFLLLVLQSHLTQVRGLKCCKFSFCVIYSLVAPHAGAWIEMVDEDYSYRKAKVAPHAGAWIEILYCSIWVTSALRRTSRRCVDWNYFCSLGRWELT